MIKSLQIENFQSHKYSQLEFSNGINVITGPSNNGKTAIIRALNWVINNRPQGLSFKSSFSDKKETCKVILEMQNVMSINTICREKSNSINLYQVGSSSFNTIGNDIPSEVISVINMSDINIQNQFEKHFLIMDSAGEVGRTINQIVKLDNIDEILSNLTNKINSTNRDLESKKEELNILNKNLEKFQYFTEIEDLIYRIIELDSQIKKTNHIIESLKYISKETLSADGIINNIENKYVDLEKRIEELEKLWVDYYTNKAMVKDLSIIINTITQVEKEILDAKTIISDDLTLQEVQENIIKFIAVGSLVFNLKTFLSQWKASTEAIHKTEKEVEIQEQNFQNTMKEIGFCPLCGQKFN